MLLWNLFLHTFCHVCWHSFWHSTWHLFWHLFWHSGGEKLHWLQHPICKTADTVAARAKAPCQIRLSLDSNPAPHLNQPCVAKGGPRSQAKSPETSWTAGTRQPANSPAGLAPQAKPNLGWVVVHAPMTPWLMKLLCKPSRTISNDNSGLVPW